GDGPRPDHQPRPAAGADRRARRSRDGRNLRAAGPPRRGQGQGRGGRAQGPAGRAGDRDRRQRAGRRRRGPRRRRPPRCLARGRLRPPHRGGGGVSVRVERRRVGLRRLEPAALGGVMSREYANFKTYWRGTTFSSLLEPIVYLLAFGLGLSATLVDEVQGIPYVQFVGTGMV